MFSRIYLFKAEAPLSRQDQGPIQAMDTQSDWAGKPKAVDVLFNAMGRLALSLI
jgi:hypothetical protein